MNKFQRVCLLGAILVGLAVAAAPMSRAELVDGPGRATESAPIDASKLEEPLAEDELDAYVSQIARSYSDVEPVIERKTKSIVLISGGKAAERLSKEVGRTVGGFTVRVQSGRFAPEAFKVALHAVDRASFEGRERVVSYSATRDFNTLVVRVQGIGEMDDKARAQLLDELQAIVQGPVKLEPALEFQNMSRSDDSAPWFGGGWMIHPAGGAGLFGDALCSTGFAVLKGTSGRLLSAGHCIRDGGSDTGTPHPTWDWRDGTGSDTLATATAGYSSGLILDSLLIDPVGGTSGQVHGGPWNATASSTSRYHLSVNNADSNRLGQEVCTSGANSGEHCDLEIIDFDHVPCSLGECHRWIAQHPTGGVAIAAGDSGGPVYKKLAATPDRVEARGIMKSGALAVPCGSVRYPASCATRVMFVGINDILDFWNVSLETN